MILFMNNANFKCYHVQTSMWEIQCGYCLKTKSGYNIWKNNSLLLLNCYYNKFKCSVYHKWNNHKKNTVGIFTSSYAKRLKVFLVFERIMFYIYNIGNIIQQLQKMSVISIMQVVMYHWKIGNTHLLFSVIMIKSLK